MWTRYNYVLFSPAFGRDLFATQVRGAVEAELLVLLNLEDDCV